jgi:hypothetical protein
MIAAIVALFHCVACYRCGGCVALFLVPRRFLQFRVAAFAFCAALLAEHLPVGACCK